MPAQPPWSERLPAILHELEKASSPVIGRAVIESVFGVRRRRAIQILHQFGGYQIGKTLVLDRAVLIGQIRTRQLAKEFKMAPKYMLRVIEEEQRHRWGRMPGRMTASRIRVPARRGKAVLEELPAGTHLARGEVRIEFSRSGDLLAQLRQLSKTIVSDLERFELLFNRR